MPFSNINELESIVYENRVDKTTPQVLCSSVFHHLASKLRILVFVFFHNLSESPPLTNTGERIRSRADPDVLEVFQVGVVLGNPECRKHLGEHVIKNQQSMARVTSGNKGPKRGYPVIKPVTHLRSLVPVDAP